MPMQRPDRHNEIELNLLQRGSLTYLLGGEKITLQAGRIAAFWAAIPHQIIGAVGHADYFVVTLPLSWFLQSRFSQALVQPILHGRVVRDPLPPNDGRDATLFAQWVDDLQSNDITRQQIVMLELEARLRRLELALPPPSSAQGQRPRPVTSLTGHGALTVAERMAAYIALHYTDRLRIEDIGRHVDLHPNYAMNLFRRTFGMTLVEFVTQHRVSHAQRLLAITHDKILDVALSSGFSSLSRFNDAFRRACGCSPRSYRFSHQVL
jgi:AraC family transcriptional regulator, melibiose operon regulatory protein